MRIGSLFSGIGGLELGLEWAGLGRVVWQVEQSEFCRRVLAKHWPDVQRFDDVREVGAANLPPVDLICGGFPCQDISSAGKGAGLAGSRSGLWYQFARIVGELRPHWVVVENVASGAQRWVDAVRGELERHGYATLPVPLSAADVGAPHLRRRVFVVAFSHTDSEGEHALTLDAEVGSAPEPAANTSSERRGRRLRAGESEADDDGGRGNAPDAERAGLEVGLKQPAREELPTPERSDLQGNPWTAQPTVRGVAYGVPHRVDRLRACGNAVVPQCAEVIGWMIRELEAHP